MINDCQHALFSGAEKYVTSCRTSSKVVNVSFDADSDKSSFYLSRQFI